MAEEPVVGTAETPVVGTAEEPVVEKPGLAVVVGSAEQHSVVNFV
jgi:hypothetical protein